MTYSARHDPYEDEHEGQSDELHPAWDGDLRRRGSARHAADRTAGGGWDWFDGGSAALDPYPVRLMEEETFDTVARDMPASRPTRRRRVERREVRSARRARRFALLTLLAIVLVIALLLTAFGGGTTPRVERLAATSVAASAQTRPFPQIVAMRGPIRLQMPVAQSQTTAIGYHSANDGALALAAIGHQGNEGVVQRVFHAVFGGGGGHPVWYQLDNGARSALDVGAAPGTDVYAPVDGTVVGITPYIVAGHRFGTRIDIEPQSAPSLVVTLTQLRADPSLTVGSNVVSGATRLGVVVNLALVERQALARFTNDAGNHVSVEVRPAALVLS